MKRCLTLGLITTVLLAGCSSAPDGSLKLREDALKQTELGKYSQAESILLPLVKTMEYKKAKSLANTTQQLAWVYMLDGKFKEAEDLANKAKYQHDKQEKPDVESQISDDNTLASILTMEGKYSDAEPLFTHGMELREGTLKGTAQSSEAKVIEAPRLASLKLGLGTLQFASGRYREAETTLQEAVSLAENDATEKKSNATPILAEALEQVALVYQANGRYSDAEAVCKRGMRMLRDSIGFNRPQFIFAANNLMSIYSDQHKYNKVDGLVKAIWQRENAIYREDHPEILRSKLLNMTSLYHIHTELKPADIQSVYQRLIASYSNLYGADNPEVIAPYQAAGEYELSIADYEQAEKNLKTALKIARANFSPNHPRTISIMDSLALTLGFKGLTTKSAADLKEAKALIQEAIAKEDSSLPEDNPIRARSLGILASIEAISDDNESAKKSFHKYLDASKRASYEEPIERIRFLKNYQSVVEKLGDKDEAARVNNLLVANANVPHANQSSMESLDLDLK